MVPYATAIGLLAQAREGTAPRAECDSLHRAALALFAKIAPAQQREAVDARAAYERFRHGSAGPGGGSAR